MCLDNLPLFCKISNTISVGLVKLELLSNATTMDSALNYIRNKQQQKRQLALDSTTTATNENNSDGSNSSDGSNDGQVTTTATTTGIGRQTVF
jgi:hypothetical protein